MFCQNQFPLSAYCDVTPLCEKGHVVLVRNEADGNLYVKKYIQTYNPEVYFQLWENPVANIPRIYGIYEMGPEERAADKGRTGENRAVFEGKNIPSTRLIVIEEYIPGSTIGDNLMEQGLFSEKDTISICLKLCRILMELHGMKPAVIHRDIKPSNIILTPEKDVILLDFNAAKTENADGGRDTVLLGTAGFAAPEQYGFTTSSPQTDIYAVGVLMNMMLFGTLPTVRVAGGKLNSVIRRCLEINPRDRYASVRELYSALKRMEKVKAEWMLPGFRTMKIYKMIPAAIVYLLLLVFAAALPEESFLSIAEARLYSSVIFAAGLFAIFFCCNYLDMQSRFPFMRSRHKWVRILGLLLTPVVVFWGLVFLAAAFAVEFLQ